MDEKEWILNDLSTVELHIKSLNKRLKNFPTRIEPEKLKYIRDGFKSFLKGRNRLDSPIEMEINDMFNQIEKLVNGK